jgi:hypothetical protein
MQWSKVSAGAALLLLLLGGCAAEADGSDQEASVANPNRALTLEVVDHESTVATGQGAPVVNPGPGEVESGDANGGKPQPDPWKGATTDSGNGVTVAPNEPRPGPVGPDNNTRNTTAQ